MTTSKGSGPPIRGTVYISGVNRARKVKSDAQVAMNKNSHPEQTFLGVAGRTVPPTFKLLELSETSRARKLIFGLHVNIDKA